MSGVWGVNLKISLFGESHGPGIGMVMNGLPAGITLDLENIRLELGRRAPGKSALTTPRREKDQFEILSGVFQNRTTGSPLCMLIRNEDQHAQDYEAQKDIMRPGHADYTARVKYAGYHDYRGGGHFSGRLTAPLVLAGAIGKQILGKKNIVIASHILRIADIQEEEFDAVGISGEFLQELRVKEFPVLDEDKGRAMKERILQAKEAEDSVGGVIETAVTGLEAGIGSPFFDSVESKIAQLLFSIPAVKGVEFGEGFRLSQRRGSEANDFFCLDNGKIRTESNRCGGILGGITNGMPLIFKTAFKPTPSIGREQKTVNLALQEEVVHRIKGRHDPCIAVRAVPAVEAAAALGLLDLMMETEGTAWMI